MIFHSSLCFITLLLFTTSFYIFLLIIWHRTSLITISLFTTFSQLISYFYLFTFDMKGNEKLRDNTNNRKSPNLATKGIWLLKVFQKKKIFWVNFIVHWGWALCWTLHHSRLPMTPRAIIYLTLQDSPKHWWRHTHGDHSPSQPDTETLFRGPSDYMSGVV